MKTEDYLAAVSRAMDTFEGEMGQAYEDHARALRNRTTDDKLIQDALDAVFMARIGRAYLAMMDTTNNLRKWPRA